MVGQMTVWIGDDGDKGKDKHGMMAGKWTMRETNSVIDGQPDIQFAGQMDEQTIRKTNCRLNASGTDGRRERNAAEQVDDKRRGQQGRCTHRH